MAHPPASKLSSFLIIIFLALFFVLFTKSISDGDCFWHLATGKWIAEHHVLPDSDPLSFTVTDHNPWRPESQRVPFLLKQYWLGQLALYGTWKLAGSTGIVLLRAVTYTVIIAFLWGWMRRISQGIAPFVLVVLTGFLLREIPNERPQLFSFLLMPLTLYLLEYISERDKGHRKAALIALPVIILVWANTHGAYLLGVMLIACYLGIHLLYCLRDHRKPDFALLTSLVTAGAMSFLNPVGITIWKEFLSTNATYSSSIYETLTPWFAAIKNHDYHPAYWISILLAIVGLLRCRSTVKPVHLLVVSALICLSLTGLRYLVFPLLAAPLFVRYLPTIPVTIRSATLLVIFCAVWLGFTWDNRVFEFKEQSGFPAGGAAFLRQQAPLRNCFNFYDWGGYLSWTVPGLKTFIDGRGLIEEISNTYDEVMEGKSWRETMDRYNINYVIIPGMSETPGTPYPLAKLLVDSTDWKLVFADDVALVFVRDVPENSHIITRYAMDRRALQIYLLKFAERLITRSPNAEGPWQTKANALQRLGDKQAALAAYRRTLQINPNNTWARRMVTMGEK